jgi:hypothetical protein
MAQSVLNQARKILSRYDPTDGDGLVWCIGTTIDNKKVHLRLGGTIANPEIWEAIAFRTQSNWRLKQIRINGRMMR